MHKSLERLADYISNAKALKEKVRSALIYPAILVVVAILSLVALLVFMVPQFQPLFEDMGKSMPVSTQVVMAVGTVFKDYWWAMGNPLYG